MTQREGEEEEREGVRKGQREREGQIGDDERQTEIERMKERGTKKGIARGEREREREES